MITGIWPLVGMGTFLLVTGSKTDLWLVNTVGLLLAVIGAVLFSAGLRKKAYGEFFLLGAGSSAVLALVDIYYVWSRIISPVYLLDAGIEIVLIALWIKTYSSGMPEEQVTEDKKGRGEPGARPPERHND